MKPDAGFRARNYAVGPENVMRCSQRVSCRVRVPVGRSCTSSLPLDGDTCGLSRRFHPRQGFSRTLSSPPELPLHLSSQTGTLCSRNKTLRKGPVKRPLYVQGVAKSWYSLSASVQGLNRPDRHLQRGQTGQTWFAKTQPEPLFAGQEPTTSKGHFRS